MTISTLKACAPLLENHKKALGQTFYNNLFRENPVLRNQFNMSNQRTNSQGSSLANAVVAFCANCDQLEALGPTVAKVANRHVSLEVTPAQYNVVGGTLLASLEEVLGKEVFNAEVKEAVAEGYFFLADIFIKEEAKMIAERISAQGGWHGWRKFQLAKKEPESSLHTSFYFAPEDGDQTARFEGGQYTSIRLQMENVDHLVVRSYTLTDQTKDGYRITVKREDGGLVSPFLHDQMKLGDSLELSAPAGEFTLQKGPEPRVFIGGGTGITPLMSMLREAAQEPSTPVIFYIYHHPLPPVNQFLPNPPCPEPSTPVINLLSFPCQPSTSSPVHAGLPPVPRPPPPGPPSPRGAHPPPSVQPTHHLCSELHPGRREQASPKQQQQDDTVAPFNPLDCRSHWTSPSHWLPGLSVRPISLH